MGIFKIGMEAISSTLSDQWLESVEPAELNNEVLATYGVIKSKEAHKRNNKGSDNVISNGSVIHVPDNCFMLLIDGGKIIAATDEPGYHKVDNSRSPSVFFNSINSTDVGSNCSGEDTNSKRHGILSKLISESWERFKFAGGTPVNMSVVYINKQELVGLNFGTKTPVPYTDRVLVPGRGVPCKITSFGSYSIKIGDPLLFYSEVCGKTGKKTIRVSDMAEQYLNEFLMSYQTALASLSANNIMVSDIPIKTLELGQYMAEALDKEWMVKRGFFIQSVGIAGISYDDATQKLLDRYANDSILFDPNARAARMTEGLAQGLSDAGSNGNGAMFGFANMNMGMGMANMMGSMPNQQYSQQPIQQPVQQPVQQQTVVGMNGQPVQQQTTVNMNGQPVANTTNTTISESWSCTCGSVMQDNAKFCFNCGLQKPTTTHCFTCTHCNWTATDSNIKPKFCPNCGQATNL